MESTRSGDRHSMSPRRVPAVAMPERWHEERRGEWGHRKERILPGRWLATVSAETTGDEEPAMNPVMVEVWRGNAVESEHAGSLAVLDR